MARWDWLDPRQRLLMLVSPLLFQVVADAWSFSKHEAKISLPFDYPLQKAFYRVAVVLSAKESSNNVTVQLSAKVEWYGRQDNEAFGLGRKQAVKLDKSTGILKLIKRPPSKNLQGKKRHKVIGNLTVTGRTKNEKPSEKLEILLEFSDSLDSYCTPRLHTCFAAPSMQYYIPEDAQTEVDIDYLMNPDLPSVCPNLTTEYLLLTGSDFLSLNSTTGVMRLISEIDAESERSVPFHVSCRAGKQTFPLAGNINAVDVNDNPPTTADGNVTEILFHHINAKNKTVNFAIRAHDKDSLEVNILNASIVNDSLSLFTIGEPKVYAKMDRKNGSNTFLYADVYSRKNFAFPGKMYNFSVVIEDLGLQQENRKAIYEIKVINDTNLLFEMKDVYEVNISRRASKFARVIQLLNISFGSTRFAFSKSETDDNDWLSITNETGIVFIKEPQLMTPGKREQRNVIWWWKNETQEETGTSLLIINIDKGEVEHCGELKWCSFYNTQDLCEKKCGRGSPVGTCTWRPGSLTSVRPRGDYATCSPDLSTCPDGECDELEQKESTLCPQDCAKDLHGEVVVRSGRGILMAVGPCTCPTPERCKCLRPYQPMQQIVRTKELSKVNLPAIQIDNITPSDADKLSHTTETETSTSVDWIASPGYWHDGSCGITCIALISVAPCAIVLIVVIICLSKRYKKGRENGLKIRGSRISLSAVPSDYVEERSNSVQDSRTTSCDTPSSGKMVDAKWEFPRSRLQLQTVLGEGEFGKVMKAQALNIGGVKGFTTVAVKMLKENGGVAEMQDLISEYHLLKEISHPNVIRLLGACTEKGGPFYLIVEYAEMGSLRTYLRKRRRHNNCCRHNATYGIRDAAALQAQQALWGYYQFTCERTAREPSHTYFHKEQLSFAWQIAKGMAYLTDMKLIHRDLAARNVLLAKQKVAKISDFGLSRDVYEGETYLKKTKGRVPIKWMALESLEDQVYTSRSDVWSFGIVLWEIMTQGATPYPGVTPQRLYNLLKAGYRMSKPDYCPDNVYNLMRQCWRRVPHERPSFKELVQKLDYMLQDTVEYMDFVNNNELTHPSQTDQPQLNISDQVPVNIQYTSVQVNSDEDISDQEAPENIGLVNLFESHEPTPRESLLDHESIA